jgi:hypothetical protein
MMIASNLGNLFYQHFVEKIDISLDLLKSIIAAAITGSLMNLSYL